MYGTLQGRDLKKMDDLKNFTAKSDIPSPSIADTNPAFGRFRKGTKSTVQYVVVHRY